MSGYYPVEIPVDFPEEVTGIQVGGINALSLKAGEGVVTVMVQGAPSAGVVDVVLSTAKEDIVYPGAFTYKTPVDPVFERLVFFGASLTQGVQSGAPSEHGTLISPSARIAAAAGAYLPLPLLVPGLFSQIEVSDVQDCGIASVTEVGARSLSQAMETLDLSYANGRQDPAMETQLVAVVGTRVVEVREGGGDYIEDLVAHLAYDATADWNSDPPTQLARLQALQPTIAISLDMTGNDALDVLLDTPIDPTAITDPTQYSADLDATLFELAALGAEVFLADLPSPSLLPLAQLRVEEMQAEGMSEEEISAILEQIDARVAKMNEELATKLAAYPTLHLIPLNQKVTELLSQPEILAGEEILVNKPFGGLTSLDQLHFSDVGYAIMANIAIEALNTELGLELPLVDLEEVVVNDPFSPSALAKGGLECP
jgi:lysophospholipase L1-like esterase